MNRAATKRLEALEAQHQRRLDAGCMDLLRAIWRAHDRLSLADSLALREDGHPDADAAEARRMALIGETGAAALESALFARYGQPAVDATADRLWDALAAGAARKDGPLSDDERGALGLGNAIAALYKQFTDSELEALQAATVGTAWAMCRELAARYGML